MATTQNQNLEKLSVLRGGLYAKPRAATPGTQCARRVRARVVAMLRAQSGIPIKDRALENVAAGVTNPTGEPVKLIGRLRRARRSFEQAWLIVIEPQVAALHDEYGRNYTTGEFAPPLEPAA